MKQKKIYNTVKIIVFFSSLFLLVLLAARITERKDSQSKYADFMELSNQIDVLFLGSSHVLYGINPVQLYAEHGITSYNMAKQGGIMTESYWTLMNALDYCSPKCVVVDLWALNRNYQYLDDRGEDKTESDWRNAISLLHNNMDFWPLSKNKLAATNDLIAGYETKKEFIWNFTLYHDRWSTLEENDYRTIMGRGRRNEYLGAEPMRTLYRNPKVYQPENTQDILSEDIVCVQYLYKILDECEKRGIKVVFTFMPMAVSYEQDWQAVNTARQIAEERNIPFINLLPQEAQAVIDYQTDMCDDSHLNYSGMRKVTAYIGTQLCNLFAMSDHRGDASYSAWEIKVNEWQTNEINLLLNETELYLELEQIQNVNANAVIFMRGGAQALEDQTVRRLIKQLTGTAAIDDAASKNGPYLLLRDAGSTCNYEFAGDMQPDEFLSVLGNTTYIGTKDFGAIYVDENFENNYLDMEEHYYDDVQILILGQNGEILQHLFYNPTW